MSELEYAGLVLEDQLLDHLATPEGCSYVWRERLAPEILNDADDTRIALQFVLEYMDDRREPPHVSVLAEETGFEEFEEPIAPIDYVVSKLRERYQRKQMKEVIRKLGRLSGEPEEALRYGLAEMARIKTETAAISTYVTEKNLIETVDDYQHRLTAPQHAGVTTGYPAIDDHLGGFRLGEVTVVLARPKRYKSWQLTTSACGAIVDDVPVAIGTMELSEREMRDRVTCQLAGVSWYRFQHRMLTDVEIDKLSSTAEEVAETRKVSIFRPKPSDRTVSYLVNAAMEAEAKILYIDQLSWFDGAKDEGNWRIIGQIMEELKDAAQYFPIFMAAQYNRQAAQEEGLADVSKAGLSGFIEQTADHLLGIYASKDMLENKIFHYGVLESRTFLPCTWEIKANLSEDSGFKLLNALD